jgi:hypothetical protein
MMQRTTKSLVCPHCSWWVQVAKTTAVWGCLCTYTILCSSVWRPFPYGCDFWGPKHFYNVEYFVTQTGLRCIVDFSLTKDYYHLSWSNCWYGLLFRFHMKYCKLCNITEICSGIELEKIVCWILQSFFDLNN